MKYRRAKLEGKWRQYGENQPRPHHGLFYHEGYQYSTPPEYGAAQPMGNPEAITREQYRTALQSVLVEEVIKQKRDFEAAEDSYTNILRAFDSHTTH